MRILHISSARAFGGGERHLVDLVQELAQRGHEVHVALRPGSMLEEKLGALPARNLVRLPLRNALDVGSARRLARTVRERRIEIVHAHMARDYPLAALATRRNRLARLIITRHVLFPLKRLHALVLSHVARVIAVSEPVACALKAQRIFPTQKIVVIPNGIELERFNPATKDSSRASVFQELQIARERSLVGTLGELNRLKGHEEFLRAAALIAEQIEEVDFIIAGADSSPTGEHRAALEQLIGALNLRGRVHLVGWLDDVAPLLCALDVFVSASRTESFGLAIVEAMACGVAVVATATEGARSIIEDNVTGRLVSIGDVEALAASVKLLLSNSGERNRLGERARAAARERFSLEQMVQATEQVYLEALRAV
ncbi:MAG TPA: glycosyltransferase family 4 protein [Pyrinomonadaceae bacterium]|nr:glycosyltransferase family 4 protein [Pyrinomonadaceae bacterium]